MAFRLPHPTVAYQTDRHPAVFDGLDAEAVQANFDAIAMKLGVLDLIHFGNGSPEGVVTAPVGHVYLRFDGGAATVVYAKNSGSGNTGWGAVLMPAHKEPGNVNKEVSHG